MQRLRYNPWALLDELHGGLRCDTLGDTALIQAKGAADGERASVRWSPAVDIHEEPDCFVLRFDLPGVDPDHVELTVEQGILTIQGERHEEGATEAKGYRLLERVYGSFQRRFSLPETTDPDSVEADYDRGVLQVRVAKKEQLHPRKIRIERKH